MYRISNYTALVLLLLAIHFNSCKEQKAPAVDFATLSESEKRKPENALASMEVAEGLQLGLFASEPMLTNPTNMAIDAKGRVWICEGKNYRSFANPEISYDNKGDRILILEDTDGDGKADIQKVFYQGQDINAALGIVVLGNKVIVSDSPKVLVFTDDDGDDIPDSKEVLFSGIEGVDHDHGVHAFVFGPDGRLYFNQGNMGERLLDKDGNTVVDIYGNPIDVTDGKYQEGMVFRMEEDGTNVEVLGDNFRNPYELAVDSYGGLWQSDNDDDGNRGTRLNFVMEYGNYGYKDLLTRQSWRERRTGWSDEISKRHWHLNDPGTVPNLLQTGSGSPCGILVYEDDLLPEKYHNQLIHAEPGHNVVRSYLLKEEGAGYGAKIENLVTSSDNWFRPDDVTVAPDGSVFIADWYDGGVGGHKAEDIARGRIYRVAPEKDYSPVAFDFTTGEGAAKGLLSDNMDAFYQSWHSLHAMGEEAEPFLKDLIAKEGIAKARALWIGAKIPAKKSSYIESALADTDEKYRVQGIRMARYLDKRNLEAYLEKMVADDSPRVRREAAIALSHLGTPKAAELWAILAEEYPAGDRWYLEALGIGSDIYPDLYFAAWKNKVGKDWMDEKGKDIVWRTRASESVPLLAEMIRNEKVSEKELPSYFRAFNFKENPKKNEILLSFLKQDHPLSQEIKTYAVGQLDADFLNGSQRNIRWIKNVLPTIHGTPEWLMAIKKLNFKDQNEGLFKVVVNGKDEALRKETATVLFDLGGSKLVGAYLKSDAPDSSKMEVLGLMNSVSNPEAIALLSENILSKALSFPLTQRAVEALGNTGEGQQALYALLEEGKLPVEHKTTAILKLLNSWDDEISTNAANYLDENSDQELDIDALVERKGDAVHGKEIYATYCIACHVAGNGGVEFGPALSDIGTKLSKQFLYSSIIYPSAGINFGYEGYSVTMNDGSAVTGYILSRTEDALTLRMMGRTQKEIPLAEIEKLEAMDKSLMTEGLSKVMSEDDMVDLIEYLGTLKVDEEARR